MFYFLSYVIALFIEHVKFKRIAVPDFINVFMCSQCIHNILTYMRTLSYLVNSRFYYRVQNKKIYLQNGVDHLRQI